MKITLLICASLVSWAVAGAASVEKIRNERVVAQEETLRPGEMESAGGGFASAVVFLDDGFIVTNVAGKTATRTVKRGEMIFREAKGGTLSAAGTAPMRFVRIEFPGGGSDVTLGRAGFAPDYKLLVEKGHARIYEIHIAAGSSEPQHTHRDRVVVCLSGAKLRHVLPDGHEEDSSIATDDCLWRKGQTHVGKNIGATDLWVIAIEPK